MLEHTFAAGSHSISSHSIPTLDNLMASLVSSINALGNAAISSIQHDPSFVHDPQQQMTPQAVTAALPERSQGTQRG